MSHVLPPWWGSEGGDISIHYLELFCSCAKHFNVNVSLNRHRSYYPRVACERTQALTGWAAHPQSQIKQHPLPCVGLQVPFYHNPAPECLVPWSPLFALSAPLACLHSLRCRTSHPWKQQGLWLLRICLTWGWHCCRSICAPQDSDYPFMILAQKAAAPRSSTLAGKSHTWRSLAGYSPWGRKESGMTEQLHIFL